MKLLRACLSLAVALAGIMPAHADIVFEETSKTEGMPMPGGENKTKILISGGKYRAQKKMNMSAGDMASSMQMSQQMSGSTMKEMNKMMRSGNPEYPDKILSLNEWLSYPENKKYIDLLNTKSNKLKDAKAGLLKGFGLKKKAKTGAETRQDADEEVRAKYGKDLDAGIRAKIEDEMASDLASGKPMELLMANRLKYDDWMRSIIIRDALGTHTTDWGEDGKGGSLPPSLRGKKHREVEHPGTVGLAEVQKISDPSTEEYQELKKKYEMNAKLKEQYASMKEGREEAGQAMAKMQADVPKMMSEELSDMLLNVQIVRADEGKVYELIPPNTKKGDSPKPEDIQYTEKSLDQIAKQIRDTESKREDGMRQAEAKMKAQGHSMGAMGKAEAKMLGTEKVNGITCEHWKLSGGMGSGDQEFWVSKSFAGADEILQFDSMLKQKIGKGRDGLAFGGGGAAMGAGPMVSSKDMEIEIEKIKARGVIIRHKTVMKGAGMSGSSMTSMHAKASAGTGDIGAKHMQAAQAGNPNAAKDPAAMQKMLEQMGQGMGQDMQAKMEKQQAAGEFNQDMSNKPDMVTITEIKVIGTDPVKPAAFEVPPGAKKK